MQLFSHLNNAYLHCHCYNKPDPCSAWQDALRLWSQIITHSIHHTVTNDNQFKKQKLKFFNFYFQRYDHLRKEASDYQPGDVDKSAEKWRAAIETAFTEYRSKHYKNGVVTIYGSSSGGNITIIACLESHQFQPRNFW